MDGTYFELADGAIYHQSKRRDQDKVATGSLFYYNKVYMMAERTWYVEMSNWVVIKDRHDPEGIIDRPPRSTFTEMDKAQILLSAVPCSEYKEV
jgi:hypothetical protein